MDELDVGPKIMQQTIHFNCGEEHISPQVQGDERHRLDVVADERSNFVTIECTSREALFEFGRSLIQEALYGQGEVEFFPLVADGKLLVVDGVRLGADSARLFIHYPKENAQQDETQQPLSAALSSCSSVVSTLTP